jgi:hypothetical protein
MDKDVAELLLVLLNNSPIEIRGAELAKLADLHARALAQVQELADSHED